MGGSSYDHILKEVQQLQHTMEELERTNRELRLQLANLRKGHGLVLDIGGKRFTLSHEQPALTSVETSPEKRTTAATHEVTHPVRKTTILPDIEHMIEEQATQATSTPSVASQPQEVSAAAPSNTADESEPTFLEEIMYDEFANQMTSPLSVWTGPAKKPEPPDEAQKAALRRELMGSFLLE